MYEYNYNVGTYIIINMYVISIRTYLHTIWSADVAIPRMCATRNCKKIVPGNVIVYYLQHNCYLLNYKIQSSTYKRTERWVHELFSYWYTYLVGTLLQVIFSENSFHYNIRLRLSDDVYAHQKVSLLMWPKQIESLSVLLFIFIAPVCNGGNDCVYSVCGVCPSQIAVQLWKQIILWLNLHVI